MTIRERRPSLLGGRLTRRDLLRTLGSASILAPVAAGRPAAAQGRCMTTYGAPECNTSPIPPVFASTGWRTVALDHITIAVVDHRAEAAFYAALMGWTPRREDDGQAVVDIGPWGTVVFRQAPAGTFAAPEAGRGRRGPTHARVESFGFAVAPWDRHAVETALVARGLSPRADHDGHGFESFHIVDPDGFPLQISNGKGHSLARRTASTPTPAGTAPFEATGWQTVWLDHFSFGATDYKKSASFYMNLLGWQPTYDEGSQHELMMGDVGDIIIRGGNALVEGGGANGRGRTGIDHISFGIAPWDTDGVRMALEARGLRAQVDTSSRHKGPDGTWVPDEIHTAAFKSYHTETPNGYNLQISNVTRQNRLALATAVDPKKVSGPGRE
ncbi:MAG: VOC family protein [Vicinamibacterales bacterium]